MIIFVLVSVLLSLRIVW